MDILKTVRANQKKFNSSDKFCLIGVRGYFADMGKKGVNDRGIYDDMLAWVELDSGRIHQFNANVDPTGYRKGHGYGSTKGMASLMSGVWRYLRGWHNGSSKHEAFRQAADVTVLRDGNPPYKNTGKFGINIHRGGVASTSSLGCQTIPPKQWDDFRNTGYNLLKKFKQKDFAYLLVDLKDMK